MTGIIAAAVMCGGRATRMKEATTEKPLIEINKMPMVERVISALASSRKFDRIIAIVSPNTPNTKEFLKSKGYIDIIETSGEGFSRDLSFLPRLKPSRVLVVPADLPLLNARIVSEIVGGVAQMKQAAVSIAIEKEFAEKIGVKPSVIIFDKYCHSGITIFDTARIIDSEHIQEQYIIKNRIEIAVNVNTKEEIELAKKLLVQCT